MGKFESLVAQADIPPLPDARATGRDPNKDMIRLYTFAEIAGEDPLAVLERARNGGDLGKLLREYEAKALQTLNETPPESLTDRQLNGVADLFTAKQHDGKSWPRLGDGENVSQPDKDKELERRKELVQALNAIFDTGDTQKRTAFGALIGGYGGQYIGGDKGMLDKAALDKLRNMGDDGALLADRYSAELKGDDARNKVVEFARRFVGFSEYGHNRGPMVAMSMGYEGDPYCGGGMNMVYDRVFGAGLFDQKNFRSAASYAQIGAAHNALRPPGHPAKIGDIILFQGSGPSGYHVGMITEVDANGRPTEYLDFNGRAQGVAESAMRASYKGTVDIEAIAIAKGLIGPDKELKTLEDLVEKAEQDFRALQTQAPAGIRLDKAEVRTTTGSDLAAVVPNVRDAATQPALT